MFKSSKISKYIIFEYLKIFIIIYLVITNLIAIVNFLEFSRRTANISIPFLTKLKIVFFEIPKILEEFVVFIVVISSSICLKKLASRSELTVLNSFNFSLWDVLKIYTFITSTIAVIIILLLNPLFNKMSIISRINKDIYTGKYNSQNILYEQNGFWFRQQGKDKNIIITKSDKIDVSNYTFFNNSIFIFDEHNIFLKRIECDNMILNDEGELTITDAFIHQKDSKIEKENSIILKTNLKKDYINQELTSKYENIEQMSIFKTVKLLYKFSKAKLNVVKFQTKLVIFIITPLIYFIMNMIACLIISNNNRNIKNILEFSLIIFISVIYYIIQSILYALAYANRINIIYSMTIWLTLFILLCLYELIKKIELGE